MADWGTCELAGQGWENANCHAVRDSRQIPFGARDNTLDASGFTAGSVALHGAADNAKLMLVLSDPEGIENVVGTSFNDTLVGNSCDNAIQGEAGDDTIQGNGGLGTLDGQSGEDIVNGQEEDAVVVGGLGDNTTNGGAGTNRMVESADADFTLTNTSLTFGSNSNMFDDADIHEAELTGGASANSMNSSQFTNGPVLLVGLGGSDTLIASPNDDALDGGAGDDTMDGRAGDDTYVFALADLGMGGFGVVSLGSDSIWEPPNLDTDTLDFSRFTAGNVTIDLSQAADSSPAPTQTVSNGKLSLLLQNSAGLENVIGSPNDDTLTGNRRDNRLAGGLGDDTYRFCCRCSGQRHGGRACGRGFRHG